MGLITPLRSSKSLFINQGGIKSVKPWDHNGTHEVPWSPKKKRLKWGWGSIATVTQVCSGNTSTPLLDFHQGQTISSERLRWRRIQQKNLTVVILDYFSGVTLRRRTVWACFRGRHVHLCIPPASIVLTFWFLINAKASVTHKPSHTNVRITTVWRQNKRKETRALCGLFKDTASDGVFKTATA